MVESRPELGIATSPIHSDSSLPKNKPLFDFQVGEYLDVLDTVNRWCNAQILQVDPDKKQVFVHYTGYAAKYDEWIDTESEPVRILKQWRRGMPFMVNNRVDVLD